VIIDSHLHVWRATTYDQPGATIVSPHSDVPVELLEEYMDEHGVDRAVLVQPLYPGEDNSYVADSAADKPEKFAAVCVVDPRRPGAAERLAYWANERGCKGLRLRPRISGEAECFGDVSTFPLWEQARSSGIVINVLANPEHLDTLGELAARFSDVDIIVDHLAHPDVTAGVGSAQFKQLLGLASYPRVHVKATGYYYYSREAYPWHDCWDYVRAVYDHFGADRMLWGSDFPHVLLKSGYGRKLLLPEREFSFLNESERAKFLGDNASRLYFAKYSEEPKHSHADPS
jgi:predicted TIM-barrel fold metal-dependent hydrolase